MFLYTAELKSRHCGLNLRYEDFFFTQPKDEAAAYLFFYENFPAIVLGKSLDYEQEVFSHKKHPPVFRRSSGGGSVLHTIGNLNYSIFLSLAQHPEFMNVSLSYEKIMSAVSSKLGRFVVRRGYSDLAVLNRGAARKISGNAQCRRRGWIMHHGTLLYSKDAIGKIPYFLKPPPKEPEYRKGRRHKDFMANVLPGYNRCTLIRRVRLGLAESFAAELRLFTPPALTEIAT